VKFMSSEPFLKGRFQQNKMHPFDAFAHFPIRTTEGLADSNASGCGLVILMPN
jgi:hypothetical protein